mgnify:FL=1|tara:strand:+ start:654 stop:1010 length:357 start_codon:yes stop_codon:yes gene_type:complete
MPKTTRKKTTNNSSSSGRPISSRTRQAAFIPVIEWPTAHVPLSVLPNCIIVCMTNRIEMEYYHRRRPRLYPINEINKINSLKKMIHKLWNGRFYTKIELQKFESQLRENKNKLKGKIK